MRLALMALLAARAVNLPTVQLCNGFFLPPRRNALPTIRPWESIPVPRLQHSDTRVLHSINGILARHGQPGLECVADLFYGQRALLTTFPELDHYGARADAEYIGPIPDAPVAAPIHWTVGARHRVVAYLRPSVGGVDQLLAALAASDVEVICAMPGATTTVCRHYESARLRILPHAVPLNPLLREASLVITYGGPGTIAVSLLAGVPLLLVPHMVEHYLCCLRVQELGVGVLVGLDRSRQRFEAALTEALSQPQYRERARAFAARHGGFDSRRPINSATTAIIEASYRSKSCAGQ